MIIYPTHCLPRYGLAKLLYRRLPYNITMWQSADGLIGSKATQRSLEAEHVVAVWTTGRSSNKQDKMSQFCIKCD